MAWSGSVCPSLPHSTFRLNTGLVSFTNHGVNLTAAQVADNMAHEVAANIFPPQRTTNLWFVLCLYRLGTTLVQSTTSRRGATAPPG